MTSTLVRFMPTLKHLSLQVFDPVDAELWTNILDCSVLSRLHALEISEYAGSNLNPQIDDEYAERIVHQFQVGIPVWEYHAYTYQAQMLPLAIQVFRGVFRQTQMVQVIARLGNTVRRGCGSYVQSTQLLGTCLVDRRRHGILRSTLRYY